MSGAALRTLTRGAAAQAAEIDLCCFPPAGGGPLTFAAWTKLMPPETMLRAAAYPLTEEDEKAPNAKRSIQQIAFDLADQLPRASGERVFLGHSMGALVAFELIRELHRRGEREPELLAVAGHAAPEMPPRHSPWHRLPSDQLWDRVAELGGTRQEVLADQDLRSALEPRMRADFAACETYEFRPGRPLHCDVLAFAGDRDSEAPPDSVEAWRNHTLGSFYSTVYPAGHFFINTHAEHIIETLTAHLTAH